jgi:hypothetical protein
MREAQRRRRERLRAENQRFLQVILPEVLRERLYIHAIAREQTLQEYVLVLIKQGLERAEAQAFKVNEEQFSQVTPQPVEVQEAPPANIVPMEIAHHPGGGGSAALTDDVSRSEAAHFTPAHTEAAFHEADPPPLRPVESEAVPPPAETAAVGEPESGAAADDKSTEKRGRKKKTTPQLELF